jgi:hypothetical protein
MTIRTLTHDLGTYEGFNFQAASAIEHSLDGNDVLAWDHDRQGEAEFWPAGDHSGGALVFAGRSAITATDLTALDRLLSELGNDSLESYARIAHALGRGGQPLPDLSASEIEELGVHVFVGQNFLDVRRTAAYELFELYYPDLYRAWESTPCDGLRFDTDQFLDSPAWCLDEFQTSEGVVLVIGPG